MKTIKLVVEDPKRGRVVISITEKEARAMYDLAYMIGDFQNVVETLKLNKAQDSFDSMHLKFAKVIDALDDGKAYTLQDGKFVRLKQKSYHSQRKPVWKNIWVTTK